MKKLVECRQGKFKTGLIDLCKFIYNDVNTMIELGCYQGESTEIFAKHLNLKQLLAIDPFINGYCKGDICSDDYPMTDVEYNFDSRIKYNCIEKIKKRGIDHADSIKDKSIDFVYIDAIHNYEDVKADILMWQPKAREWIGGHDYVLSGVVKAVNEVFGKPDHIFNDYSWLIKI